MSDPIKLADVASGSGTATTGEASISVEAILKMIETTVHRQMSTALTAAGISGPALSYSSSIVSGQ